MQDRHGTWIPLSAATARMWALEALAETRTPRRRLMPALRRVATALTQRRRRRPHTAPGGPVPAHAPMTAAPGAGD